MTRRGHVGAPAATAAPGATALRATLENCDREPIHIPGAIQACGALLAFEPGTGTILHASTNLRAWLPVGDLPAKGRAMADLLGADACDRIAQALAGRAGTMVRHEVVDLPPRPACGQAEALEALVHIHRGVGFVELEPATGPADDGDWLQGLSDTIDALRSATGLEDLYQRMALRVKRLTRFDRVMVYRFDEDHHGQVIADEHEPGMESFHDLHYPASDIPAQARDLYVANLVRYIPDVGYTPVPVLPWLDSERLQPLDMSHAMLRSVSPMHVQYLQNMGVGSTLTLSLLVDGRLWGLIACHHRLPTALPLRLRRACYALAVTAGYMVGWYIGQKRQADAAQTARAQASIVDAFNQVRVPLPEVIEHCAAALLQMVGASGGALWHREQVVPFGRWPDGARAESILRFVRHAFETSTADRVDTEQAGLQPPLEPHELRVVCGLMAVKFDGFAASGLIWLRPEYRREVQWGGDPDKPVQVELDARGRPVLSPRSSFARWTTLVRQRCRPWDALDREAADSLAVLRQVLVVRDSVAQVSLSNRQFHSLVTLQSDAYWQTDLEGRLQTLSKPLRVDHGPLEDRLLPEIFAAHCEADGVQALQAALARRRAFSRLRLCARADAPGPAFAVLISGEPMRDVNGTLCGWHGTLNDVTHEAEVDLALRQKAAAELASLSKSRLMSQVSHELRTPLNAVLGFSQLMVTDPSTPPLQRSHARHVHQAATWLLTMISDLLDLSKIETGNLAVSMAEVDVRALLDDVHALVENQAAERSITLSLPADTTPCWVRADRVRLCQVLVNLCSNAIKYNKVAGEARLTLADDADGEHLRIEVADTGHGLSAAQLEHLYEPFNRLGREGLGIGGTGIGLAISKQLVTLMGGRIEVSSQPGQGSRFTVVLARSPAPAEPLPAPEILPVGEPDGPAVRGDGLVLYVEDDPVNELLMRAMVADRLGYRYQSAASAEQGLKLAGELHPAVMLVDFNLPGNDGAWLAASVRADPLLAGVRMIAVTADATELTRRRLIDTGFEDCWCKPVDLAVVDAGLQRMFRRPGP